MEEMYWGDAHSTGNGKGNRLNEKDGLLTATQASDKIKGTTVKYFILKTGIGVNTLQNSLLTRSIVTTVLREL